MKDKQETRIKRAHVALMKHPETALYSGVMLMGTTEVSDEKFTAYTDGVNKRYSRPFLETILSEAKCRGLILHENLHVALKQIPFGKSMFKENAKMANLAADFVVNDIIENIKGTVAGSHERIVELPDGAVYDAMFHNWSMREVYNYLKQHAKPSPKKQKPQPGKPCNNGGSGSVPPSSGEQDDDGQQQQEQEQQQQQQEEWDTVEVNGKVYDISQQDEHDFEKLLDGMTHEQIKEINDSIDKALREGGMLAGRMGAKLPRAITELLEPKIDWREALRDFVSSTVKGKDEFTWRRMNKRHMANDIYLPNVENETIGEVIVAIDTSGSIGSAELTEFASELASICQVCEPEKVRILWWDTAVHGEQVFDKDYANIAGLLKPLGGGGTHVSCVSDYINKQKLQAECVIVFTDGYVENDIKWDISSPTLWMITQNKSIEVPGKKVVVNRD
jgi:predicted metal-dependent peptidase